MTELGPYDVLLGRGAPCMKNPGNVRFRQFVEKHRSAYCRSWKTQVKAKIASSIQAEIHARNGHFLRPLHINESLELGVVPPETVAVAKMWVLADTDAVIES